MGALADLVLVGDDPLKDVRALRDIVGVCLAGRWYDADALAHIRGQARRAGRSERSRRNHPRGRPESGSAELRHGSDRDDLHRASSTSCAPSGTWGRAAFETCARGSRRTGAALAYNTVQTLLNRLAEKGQVRLDKRGSAFVYKAAMPRDKAYRARIREFVQEMFDGSAQPLVSHLVREGKLKPNEVEELTALLDREDAAGRIADRGLPPGAGRPHVAHRMVLRAFGPRGRVGLAP